MNGIARYLSFVVILFAACGGGQSGKSAGQTDTLTERQRDSILAHSRIPGAAGVGSAMKVADSTSAHIRAADTVSQ